MRKNRSGYTIIELMLAVAILSILVSIAIPQMGNLIFKAKVSQAVSTLTNVRAAVEIYVSSVGDYPPYFHPSSTVNPLLEDPGVPNWAGPYISNLKPHRWGGGNISLFRSMDVDSNGIVEYMIGLDDDRAGTSFSDNGSRIPIEYQIGIDHSMDDGDLTTGEVVGETHPVIPTGEVNLIYERDVGPA